MKRFNDGVLNLLREYGIPVTRENYLRLAFMRNPPQEPLDGEIEAEVQEAFDEYDAWVLEVMRIGGTLDPEEFDAAVPESLTTEQLGEDLLRTIEQMTPEQKAELRKQLDKSFNSKKGEPRQ